MAKEKFIVGDHKWPESIDFDQDDNLYFTDAIEKALFQIKRSKDGMLGMGESLFVTTIRRITCLWGGCNVVEIPHIQELIRSKSSIQGGANHERQ
jgi:hypothetical protein